ncbi:hypothetical protein D3C72_2197700 [compost metagenome]
MHSPNTNATPMPMRSGWCTPQKTSSSMSTSGAHTTRPSGSRFTASPAARLATMNTGFTGISSGSPRGMIIAGLLSEWGPPQ